MNLSIPDISFVFRHQHSLDSHIGLAVQLQQTLPNCHFLDQYLNPANPRAHYLGTAEEILYQCDNKVDLIVVPAGTGGAVSGIAAKVKERLPNCKVLVPHFVKTIP